MTGIRRRHMLCAAGVVFVPSAFADAYPSRPVKIIVGLSAGSATDSLARPFADKLAEALKVTIIVDNKPSGGQTAAIQALMNSPPQRGERGERGSELRPGLRECDAGRRRRKELAMSSTLRSVILASALAAVGWPQQAAATAYYTFADLGALSGGSSRALGIKYLGQFVGEASIAPEPDGVERTHALLWSGGTKADIGGLGGFVSVASDINNLGQVVGSAHILDYDGHAFLCQGAP